MTPDALALARDATNPSYEGAFDGAHRALAKALLAAAAELERMRAVVAGAAESYSELGALDLRVGEVIDEDDVRCWEAHERAIGVPLRAYRAALTGEGE